MYFVETAGKWGFAHLLSFTDEFKNAVVYFKCWKLNFPHIQTVVFSFHDEKHWIVTNGYLAMNKDDKYAWQVGNGLNTEFICSSVFSSGDCTFWFNGKPTGTWTVALRVFSCSPNCQQNLSSVLLFRRLWCGVLSTGAWFDPASRWQSLNSPLPSKSCS